MFVFLMLLIIVLAGIGIITEVFFEGKTAAVWAHVLVIAVGIITIAYYVPDVPVKERYDTEIKALQKLCVDAGIATFTPVVIENKFILLATDSVKAEKE